MSNRTETQSSAAAALRASHLAQIEALTKPGLTDRERVEAFADAAGFTPVQRETARVGLHYYKATRTVWHIGTCQRSLFATMPGCGCPVSEAASGKLMGFPTSIPGDWQPTAAELEPFSAIQIERRFPA